MARIIPPQIDPYSDVPPGEELLFNKIQDDPGAKDWIVLHSLDVARHRRKPSGELDFVTIIPNMGILCLEVKSHQHVRCENGRWYYGRDQRPGKNPFKQVRGTMHSLMDDFRAKYPDLGDVLFWSAVCFPFLHFSQSSTEWHSWEIIDTNRLKTAGAAEALHGVLRSARRYLGGEVSAGWYDPESSAPTPAECRMIADALRPHFEFFESPASRARRRSEEIKEYTKRQLVALDAMQTQNQIFFTGPAGTGKTFLIMEAARRSAAQGDRVLLLCFNRLLGKHLTEQMKGLDGVEVRTLHSLMVRITGWKIEGDEPPDFWNCDLPLKTIDRLLSDMDVAVYDRLIVDEAQDLLKENYLDVLDLLVDGGLRYGKWIIAGDFANQNIYSEGFFNEEERALTPEIFLSHIDAWAPVFPLYRNCRNTPRIARLVESSAQLNPGYSEVLRPDTGIDPEFHNYSGEDEQTRLLIQILDELYEEDYQGKDIVILSPKTPDRSIASTVEESPWKQRLCAYNGFQKGGYVRYTSIHAFKGLEAPVIILTDIEAFSRPRDRELFYIAGSRSQEKLIVLTNKEARSRLIEAVLTSNSTSN